MGAKAKRLTRWETRFAECDSAVREWMETQGWPVTGTKHRAFKRDIYCWWHEGYRRYYLWITKTIIEDNGPLALIGLLNFRKVAKKLREQHGVRVRWDPSTGLVVEQWTGVRPGVV